MIYTLEIICENIPTEILFSKQDFATGKELPRATITVTDKETVKVIDEWVSTDKPHVIQYLVEGKEELTFDQRLGILVDAEVDSQRAHKIERLINNAHFTESKASMTQIKCYSDRHLKKEQIMNLTTNEYIKNMKMYLS